MTYDVSTAVELSQKIMIALSVSLINETVTL